MQNDILFPLGGDSMYQIIESRLVLLGISKKELAQALGISYHTLLLKLQGKSSFTLDEALAVKELIRASESVEELFCRPA